MAEINVKILDFAAFFKLLFMVDQGAPGSRKLSDDIMSGNFTFAFDTARSNADYIFSAEGFKELMNTAVKYGIAKFVVNATPLKNSFTMFGITIGF